MFEWSSVFRHAVVVEGGGKKNKIIHLKLWGQLIIYRQSFSDISACLCSFSNSLYMYNQNSIIWHQTFLALEGCCNIKLFRNFGKIHFIQPKLNGFVLLLNIFHFWLLLHFHQISFNFHHHLNHPSSPFTVGKWEQFLRSLQTYFSSNYQMTQSVCRNKKSCCIYKCAKSIILS